MVYYVSESGRYVVSSGGTWIPGSYDSERAAKYACRFTDRELQSLQDELQGRAITFEMLQQLRRARPR